jgi:hypothetical protein
MPTAILSPVLQLRSAWRLFLTGALVALTLWPASVVAAKKAADPREVQARQAFAAGRYEEALDLFAKLFGEKPHPTYLRNIGRCYQNLEQPEKAINAFRDYLRQAKDLPASERREIDGYIVDMEALKKKQDDEAARAAEAARPKPDLGTAAPPPPEPKPEPVVLKPAPQPEPESPPVYKRGWFWAVVGVVVAGAVVGGLAAGGVFSSKSNCPDGRVCL